MFCFFFFELPWLNSTTFPETLDGLGCHFSKNILDGLTEEPLPSGVKLKIRERDYEWTDSWGGERSTRRDTWPAWQHPPLASFWPLLLTNGTKTEVWWEGRQADGRRGILELKRKSCDSHRKPASLPENLSQSCQDFNALFPLFSFVCVLFFFVFLR